MNRNETEIKNWLADKADGSLTGIERAFDLYVRYIKEKEGRELSAEQLIDEIDADRKKERRHRGQIERRLIPWHKWLQTEYVSERTGEPLAENSATSYVGYIQGFYRSNGFKMAHTKKFGDLFGRKAEYPKKLLMTEDVEKMIDEAKSLRDKAITLWLFEGAFDVSTLSSLNYSHVEDQLNEDFMTIKAYRKKEKWEYITHVGEFGIKALRAYLTYREKRGEVFKDDTPLFLKEWAKRPKKRKGMSEEEYNKLLRNRKRITSRQIEFLVIDLALRTGLIKKVPKHHRSPVRPHTFRMCFKTLLETAMRQVNEPYVEGWMGHKVKWRGTYWKPNEQMSLETYQQFYYKALAIRQTKERVEKRIEDQQARIVETSLAVKQLMTQIEPMQKEIDQLKQLRFQMSKREYGSITTDRRQAIDILGILQRAKEDKEYLDFVITELEKQIKEKTPVIVQRGG